MQPVLVSRLRSYFMIEFVLSGVWRGFLRQTQSKEPEQAHTAPTLRPFSHHQYCKELLRQDTRFGKYQRRHRQRNAYGSMAGLMGAVGSVGAMSSICSCDGPLSDITIIRRRSGIARLVYTIALLLIFVLILKLEAVSTCAVEERCARGCCAGVYPRTLDTQDLRP
jgi:hypothetical protein